MITGLVTGAREAVISLTVRGPNGQEQEIEAADQTIIVEHCPDPFA